ncbi:dienelactone hydrolase family protein [Promicromonospora umidemergens]
MSPGRGVHHAYRAVRSQASRPGSGGRVHPGYTAVPDGPGPFPGVVVVHDAYGMTAELRRVCDYLAERGYLVHAPSIYQRGRCLRQAFRSFIADQGPAYERLEADRAALADRPDCTSRVGIMGFCMGGRFALVAAGRGGFDAAAVNYGLLPEGRQEPAALDQMLSAPCPVVASFGARDKVVDVPEVDKLRVGLDRAGVPSDLKVYPEATHSFLAQHSRSARHADADPGHDARPGGVGGRVGADASVLRGSIWADRIGLLRRAAGRGRSGLWGRSVLPGSVWFRVRWSGSCGVGVGR